MPGNVPPVADEREGLLAFLDQQRNAVRLSAHGLTDEQARATPTVSPLSVGGLVQHCASTERTWIDLVLQRDDSGEGDYETNFRLGEGETLADVLGKYEEVAGESMAAALAAQRLAVTLLGSLGAQPTNTAIAQASLPCCS